MVATLVSTAVISFGRADIEVRDKVTCALIFPLAFLLGTHFGIIGVALARCVALPITVGINLMRTRKIFAFAHREVLATLLPPAAVTALMAALVSATGWLLGQYAMTWPGLALLVLVGLATYVGTLWLVNRQVLLALAQTVSPRMANWLSAIET
jgi:Polysaccharide biosynthesis C-terminal domain